MFDEKDYEAHNGDDALWKSLFPGMYISLCSMFGYV
jgi:hypothetical protein